MYENITKNISLDNPLLCQWFFAKYAIINANFTSQGPDPEVSQTRSEISA